MQRLFLCVWLLLGSSAWAGEALQWSNLPNLPDPVGFGGPLVGTHEEALIVAGGANFPGAPPWAVGETPPGTKVWYDGIFVLEPGASEWTSGGKLPLTLAYSAVVSTDDGVYVLGGETFQETNIPTAEVLLLRFDPQTKQVEVQQSALPPLPKPCRYHAAVELDGVIYVTASHPANDQSPRLDSSSFWSLDLSLPPAERKWNELDPWPGAPREKMSLAVQASGADDRYATPKCLYLFSGATWVKNDAGELDPTRFEHFTDNYRYNPLTAKWSRIADLPVVPESRKIDLTGYAYVAETQSWRHLEPNEDQPDDDVNELYAGQQRPAVAATAIDVGQSHILVFSGSTGRYITLDSQDNPLFPRDVLAYHTITDTWTIAGEMPEGVVTTGITKWNGKVVIPSGEIRPGIRTNHVQALEVEQRTAAFGTLNLIVLGVYLSVLVAVGFYFSRRENATDDFFLAGKRIPWWAAGISIYATQLSAITFVSMPAVAYATNWIVYPGQLMILCFAPVVVLFYLPFFRRLDVTTAYEYLEKRFNVVVRLFGSLSFVTYQFGRMAIVVYLPALALSAVTGMDVYACILVMGVLSTLYTVLGGMEAVIWTDVIQVFVLWGGMLLAIVLIVADLGGASAVFQTASNDHKLTAFNWSWDTAQMATWVIILGNFALQFGPYTTDQAVVQRYMTTKDEKAAGRSIWLNGFLTLPFSLLFFVLGTCLYAFFKAHPDLLGIGMETDKVFPLFMAEQLPPGLSGLVIAGVFAASMSSLDSSMHSVATAITTDFFRRFRADVSDQHCLKIARILTVLIGASGTGMALVLAGYDVRSLFFLFQKLLGLVSSGLVGIFILGIFTRRATATGAICGAIASFAVLCFVVFQTGVNFYLYAAIGILTSVVVGYAVSLLTKPISPENIAGLTIHDRLARESVNVVS